MPGLIEGSNVVKQGNFIAEIGELVGNYAATLLCWVSISNFPQSCSIAIDLPKLWNR